MEQNIDKQALFDVTYGVYIVSTMAAGKRNGQIANTVMQITGEPGIRVTACLNKANYTAELIGRSGVFSVSVLEQDVPMTFIGLFGFKCGRDVDKFEKVKESIEMPSHILFIGEVVGAQQIKGGTPLTYADYHLIKKGKSPKTAPTFGFNELRQ